MDVDALFRYLGNMFIKILTIWVMFFIYSFDFIHLSNYNISNNIQTSRPKEHEETGMENSVHQHVACWEQTPSISANP